MSERLVSIAQWSAIIIETLGVLVIVGFAIYTLAFAAVRLISNKRSEQLYRNVRQQLGRGILLGLEFLVAADIIHTVVIELTFESVGVLAAILLIRTFLSFTLNLELTGKWPWQESDQGTAHIATENTGQGS